MDSSKIPQTTPASPQLPPQPLASDESSTGSYKSMSVTAADTASQIPKKEASSLTSPATEVKLRTVSWKRLTRLYIALTTALSFVKFFKNQAVTKTQALANTYLQTDSAKDWNYAEKLIDRIGKLPDETLQQWVSSSRQDLESKRMTGAASLTESEEASYVQIVSANEERFPERLVVCGKSGAGKSHIINTVSELGEAQPAQEETGNFDVSEGIRNVELDYKQNPMDVSEFDLPPTAERLAELKEQLQASALSEPVQTKLDALKDADKICLCIPMTAFEHEINCYVEGLISMLKNSGQPISEAIKKVRIIMTFANVLPSFRLDQQPAEALQHDLGKIVETINDQLSEYGVALDESCFIMQGYKNKQLPWEHSKQLEDLFPLPADD